MTNPFDVIEARLSNIETLLLDLKHGPVQHRPLDVPRFFGIDLCADITGFAEPTIYQKTSRKKMPHSKRDGKLVFDRDEIYAWMTENRVKTQGESLEELDRKLTKGRGRK